MRGRESVRVKRCCAAAQGFVALKLIWEDYNMNSHIVCCLNTRYMFSEDDNKSVYVYLHWLISNILSHNL